MTRYTIPRCAHCEGGALAMGAYPTFADAARRVEYLKHAGRWPGIICHPDGTCDLTWDPQGTVVTRY